MVVGFTAVNSTTQALLGKSKTDSLSCNSVGIGALRDAADPVSAATRLVVCKSDATNGGKDLIELCDENGVVLVKYDSNFNMKWSNPSIEASNTTYSRTWAIHFTHTEEESQTGTLNAPTIHGGQDLGAYLGTQYIRFWQLYSKKLICTELNETSDMRIKTNIQVANVSDCMNRIRTLTLKEYGYSGSYDEGSTGERVRGFIAQEVKAVLPRAVTVAGGVLGDGSTVTDFHYLRKKLFIHGTGRRGKAFGQLGDGTVC